MEKTVQCSLPGCYQRFETVEAMRKHKRQMNRAGVVDDDETHAFYCIKCDADCADDVEHCIHLLESPKHLACPVCFAQFKSEGGRVRHVSISHQKPQKLSCVGCNLRFGRAAEYVEHVMDGHCRYITSKDFHTHKEEQKIERDAWEKAVRPEAHVGIGSDMDGGLTGRPATYVADNQRILTESDWDEDSNTFDPATEQPPALEMIQAMSNLQTQYPPLSVTGEYPNQQAGLASNSSESHSNGGVEVDLLDLNEQPKTTPSFRPHTQSVWTNTSQPQRPRAPSSNLLDNASSVNLMGSSIAPSVNSSVADWGSFAASHNGLSRAVRPENNDPNAAHARIITKSQLSGISGSALQNCWDSIQGVYICPRQDCNKRLQSEKDFSAHLFIGVHANQREQCPSCLRTFKNLKAFIAHAESPSQKCKLRYAEDYDRVMAERTGGMIRVDGIHPGPGNAKFRAAPMEQW